MLPDTTTHRLLNPDVRANPFAFYAQLRAEQPVLLTDDPEMRCPVWLVLSYDECVTVLKDRRFGKTGTESLGDADNAMLAINKHMLTTDPPDHTRLRTLVHKAFTPRVIENLRLRIHQIANDLLDTAIQRGTMDIVSDYAFPLPMTVIAELLGVPVEDRETFRRWSSTIILHAMKGDEPEAVATAGLEFMMYFHDLIDRRRDDPQDDLISGLVAAEDAGDRLDRQELLSTIFLLLVAGHETTVNLIASGTFALLQNPASMRVLQAVDSANDHLMKTAIEEMLRYHAPVETTPFYFALEDVALGGQQLKKGDMVRAGLLAANHDPAVFKNPEIFDIEREPNRHIAFGNGIHYCLGAPLARLEGAIAMTELLHRLPGLQFATDPTALAWNESTLIRGLKTLPVRF